MQADASPMEAMSAVAQSAMLWNAVAPPAAQVPAEALATIMQTICTATSAATAMPSLATRFLVWQSAGHLLQSGSTPSEPVISVEAEPPAWPTSATGKRSRLAEADPVLHAKQARAGHGASAPDEVHSQLELPQHQSTAAVLSDAAKTCAEALAALKSVHGHTVETSNDGDGLPGLPPSALHALLTAALFCPGETKSGVLQTSGQGQETNRRLRALALCAAAVLGPSNHLLSRPTSAGVSRQRRADLARQSRGDGQGQRQRRQFTSSDPQAGGGSEQGGLQSLPDSGMESGYSSAASDSSVAHATWPQSALMPDGRLEKSSSVRAAFLDHLEPKRCAASSQG